MGRRGQYLVGAPWIYLLYLEPEQPPLVGDPREVLAKAALAPPIVQVGKLLGWEPLPLTIKEARRFASGIEVREPSAVPMPTPGKIASATSWLKLKIVNPAAPRRRA